MWIDRVVGPTRKTGARRNQYIEVTILRRTKSNHRGIERLMYGIGGIVLLVLVVLLILYLV